MTGFQIRSLKMMGPSVPVAQITFGSGLNVISGASNTGKSFLFHAIDFMFGAASLDKIPEAQPYTTAELELEAPNGRFLIRRALQGGAFELHNLNAPSSEVTVLGERLNRNDPNNISTFFLRLVNLDGKRVRKNAENALQDLSFRNLTKLIMVDEQDIIKVTSPIHGTEGTQHTAETNVFKLVLTGQDDSALVEQKKKAVAKAELEGQLELLEKLLKEYADELGDKPPSQLDLSDQLERLSVTLASAEQSLEEQRELLRSQLDAKRTLVAEHNAARLRFDEAGALIARFQLLDSHYQSDILRLDALWEAGTLFPPLSSEICPLCGAPQSTHSHEDHQILSVDVARVRESCSAEKNKIELLRKELFTTLDDLFNEAKELRSIMSDRRSRVSAMTDEIEQVTQAAVKKSERDYETSAELRYEVRQKLSTYSRIDDLTARRERTENALSSIGAPRRVATDLPLANVTRFTDEFANLLTAWQYPSDGAITFDTKSEDFTLGIRRRREQGKGSRALTHAAFTISLMNYCIANNLQHPGLVVLDSPLVTFRDKDDGISGVDGLLIDAQLQVKDAFYRDLSTRVAEQQVIIFENEEPEMSIREEIVFHHFTGDRALHRSGFFPSAAKAMTATDEKGV